MKAFAKEFKEFISRGNVIDLAVGVIIGGAFQAIVNSLVKDIVNPLIAIVIQKVTGQEDFSGLVYTVGGQTLTYGNFIGAIINFLLTALVVFSIIKTINSVKARSEELTKKLLKKEEEEKEPEKEPRKCPYCKQVIDDEATRCHHCTAELPLITEDDVMAE